MTLMLRGLGIPARVGVGFLPGVERAGEFVVSTRDAHAWVEANIPGTGWFAFDPTPGRADASSVPEEAEEQEPEPREVPQVTTVPAPTPQNEPLPEDVTEQPITAKIPAAVWYSLLAAALVAFVPTTKAIRRSRRRRGGSRDIVIGAYTDLIDHARDLGWRVRPSETHREFIVRTLGDEEHGHRLATLAARALFAAGRSDAAEAQQAWADRRSAIAALKTRSSWWRRTFAPFDPRTLLPDRPLRRARARVAASFGRA
jgi:hypothetical protein